MQSQSNLASNERGAVALEFACVFSTLVLFILGLLDLGEGMNQYLMTTRVAYEGARYAATVPGLMATNDQSQAINTVKARVWSMLDLDNIRAGTNVDVVPTGNQVVVTISRPLHSALGGSGPFGGYAFGITATGKAQYLLPS